MTGSSPQFLRFASGAWKRVDSMHMEGHILMTKGVAATNSRIPAATARLELSWASLEAHRAHWAAGPSDEATHHVPDVSTLILAREYRVMHNGAGTRKFVRELPFPSETRRVAKRCTPSRGQSGQDVQYVYSLAPVDGLSLCCRPSKHTMHGHAWAIVASLGPTP